MPLAKTRDPSGEEFQYYVPKGTTSEERKALARDAYFKRRQGIDVTQPPPPPESTIGGELMRGAESLASALRTTAGAVLGDEEAAALAALERSEDIAQKYGEGPSFQAVREAEGVLPTISTALGQIPRALAGQGAQLGATAAGAATGARLGARFGPTGAVVGGGLGALTSLIPQFAGYNIERQAEADIAEGRPVDIDTGKALGTAALQAVPELAGQYFILGRGVINKILKGGLGDTTEAVARGNAEKLIQTAREKLLPSLKKGERGVGAIGRGIATGAAAEIPTEVAQQVLERAQAGLDVLSEEALAEYGEAAYLAATIGGTLGPIGTISGRSAARRQREELAARTGEVPTEPTTEPEAEVVEVVEEAPAEPPAAPPVETEVDLTELGEAPADVDEAAIQQQTLLAEEARREQQAVEEGVADPDIEFDQPFLGRPGEGVTEEQIQQAYAAEQEATEEATEEAPVTWEQDIDQRNAADAAKRQQEFEALAAEEQKPAEVVEQEQEVEATDLETEAEASTVPQESVSETAKKEEQDAEIDAQVDAPPRYRTSAKVAAQRALDQKKQRLQERRDNVATAQQERVAATVPTVEEAGIDTKALAQKFNIAETAAERDSLISGIAFNSVYGKPEAKATALAEIAEISTSPEFSEQIKRDVIAAQNKIRLDNNLELPAKALASTSMGLEPEVMELLRDGRLVDALDTLGRNKDKTVSKVARAVSAAILKDGGTKVTLESGLMSTDGRLLAGTFDPKTNTIIINSDLNPTTHVLLHEALHAVTSHEIANKASPITKQLQTLFDNVKDRLDSSYGATSLDEFVAEAFSNPEFQTKLASMNVKGEKLGAWERFTNIIKNLVRKILKQPITQVTSARNEVDKLVTELMSPAPEYRDAARLNMAATAKEEGKLFGNILNSYGGPITTDMINTYNDTMPGLSNTARDYFLRALPLNSIADFIKDSNNPVLRELGAELDELFKVIQQKNGSRQLYLRKTKDTAKQLDAVFKELGKEQRDLFNKVVMESTLRRVDPTKERSYYEGFRYSYVDQDGKEFRSKPYKTKELRDAAREADKGLERAKKEHPTGNVAVAVTNPSEGKLEEYTRVKDDFKKLKPEAQKAYETLRDAYSEAYTELRVTIVNRINAIKTDTEEAVQAKQAYKDKILLELLNKESIEPYFPLYRKGDFWYNHMGFDPYTNNPETFKVAFESDKERQAYARLIESDPELRQQILNSKATTIVDIREAARKEALDSGATPQEAEEAAFRAALEPTFAERPTNARGEKTAVDLQWAQGLLADVRRKKDAAGERAKAKALEDGLSEAEAEKIKDQTLRAGNAIDSIVQDALLDAMPERSLERAFKRRQNVRGAQMDAIDVFRQRMPAFLGQVDKLRFDQPLRQRRNNLDAIASKARNTPDLEYAKQIARKGGEYIDFVNDPQIATWSRALKSAGFFMTLGFNLSSAVVNSFILPVVVFPFLAGKYGIGPASAAMYRAMRMYMGTGMRRRLEPFGGAPEGTEFDGPSLANLDPENLPEEYRQYKPLIEELVSRGAANTSTVGDMLDIDNPMGGRLERGMTRVNGISGFLFHQGERLNRQVTAMAMYDLAMDAQKKKNKGADITEEQRNKILDDVFLDMEHTNSGALIETAPKLAQNNIGSVLLMYKRFGVSMAYLQAKMARQALKIGNYSEKETAEAKKQLVGLFGMSGLLAGVQGLPAYGLIAGVMNQFFLDDEDDDFDSLVASYIGEGPYSGALNEIFGLDIAPRIGMSNLLFRTLPNKEYESNLAYWAELGGGPLLGIAQRMDRSYDLFMDGEYRRGIEGFVPSGLGGPLRSIRYATEGATTLRGDPIVEDMTPLSIAGQFFGFAPAGYIKQLEINARDKRIDRKINETRTRLLRQRYVAFRVGDFEGVRDVDQEINEFNQRNPEVRITGDTKARSLRQHKITSQIARQLGGITISPRRLDKVMQKRLEEMGERDFFL
jgi:hypothetical protein